MARYDIQNRHPDFPLKSLQRDYHHGDFPLNTQMSPLSKPPPPWHSALEVASLTPANLNLGSRQGTDPSGSPLPINPLPKPDPFTHQPHDISALTAAHIRSIINTWAEGIRPRHYPPHVSREQLLGLGQTLKPVLSCKLARNHAPI